MKEEIELEAAIARATKEMNRVQLEISKLNREFDEHKARVGKLEGRLNKVRGNCYYVYIVFVEGEPKYVGKGTGDRYKHAVSGASSVPELNRDFFNNLHIEVRILHGDRTLTEEKAFRYEKDVIGSLIGIFEIYNKALPKENEYDYMDCDFKEYSDVVIRNKDYRYYSKAG